MRKYAPEEGRSEVAELSKRPLTRRAPADLREMWDMLSPGRSKSGPLPVA